MKKHESPNLLVVVDDSRVRAEILDRLEPTGWRVAALRDLAAARESLAQSRFDLVLLDQDLPDDGALALARELEHADSETILLVHPGGLAPALAVTPAPVADCLVLPLGDPDQVMARLRLVLAHLDLKRRNQELRAALQEKNRDLAELVVKDPATGLFNYGFFLEALHKEARRSRRHGLEFVLLLLDIDHFKRINDTLGQREGDAVLKAFGTILKGDGKTGAEPFRLRSSDVAARYGGDEFAIILPQTPKSGAISKAEALREVVEVGDFRALELPDLTISIGLAHYPEDADDPDELTRAAERALYVAKLSGRNQVVPYGMEHAPALDAIATSERRAFDLTGVAYSYEPIVSASEGEIFAFEALAHPTTHDARNPRELYAAARLLGGVTAVGAQLRRLALARIEDLPSDAALFLYVHPEEIEAANFEASIPETWRRRLVLSIGGLAGVDDPERLCQRRVELGKQGFRVALTDWGSDLSGLPAFGRLQPEFVVLHRNALRAIRKDKGAASLFEQLIHYARSENATVVATSVDQDVDRDLAIAMRCALLQGRLFDRLNPGITSPRRKF